jgi:hypothetical protein
MKELEPIIRYKMDALEAKAFKIALIWQDECRKEISGESYARVKPNIDPRKTLLFKYCFKLARETNGVLPDSDMSLYVRSQIQVLKSINDGKMHALIEPACLVGDKAWRRWKLWKSRYDRRMACPRTSEEMSVKTSEGKMKSEILATRSFLERMGCITFEGITSRTQDITRWMKSGEISCFYLVLSPWIREIVGNPIKMDFDYFYYRASITPSVEEFFRETFDHEFKRETCQKV